MTSRLLHMWGLVPVPLERLAERLASHTVSSHHLKLMSAGSDDMTVHMNQNIFLTSSNTYSSGKKYFEVAVGGVKFKAHWL